MTKKIKLTYSPFFSMVFDLRGVHLVAYGVDTKCDGQVRVIFDNCMELGVGDCPTDEIKSEISYASALGRAALLTAIERRYDLDIKIGPYSLLGQVALNASTKTRLTFCPDFSMVFDARGVDLVACGAEPESDGQVRVIFENLSPNISMVFDARGVDLVACSAEPESDGLLRVSFENLRAQGDSINADIIAAAVLGRASLLAAIQRHYDLDSDSDQRGLSGYSPLGVAAFCGNTETCLALIDCGAEVESKSSEFENTPLAMAAGQGHTETCLELIARGADIDSKDNTGESPLHSAASSGITETCLALLGCGADLESKDDYGCSPLALAAGYKNPELCLALLRRGADLESKDSEGDSPLALAVVHGNTETCLALIEHGADLESKNNKGITPLGLAAADDLAAAKPRTELLLTLIGCGAKISCVLASTQSSDFCESILVCLAYPLHSVADRGMTRECIQMLNLGYDPIQKNGEGFTPAQLAENAEQNETASVIQSWMTRQAANRLLAEIEDDDAE